VSSSLVSSQLSSTARLSIPLARVAMRAVLAGVVVACGSVTHAGAQVPRSGAGGSQAAPDLFGHDLWSIAARDGELRWVVIHDSEASRATGIVHVEVIARKKGRPAWDVRRVADHLAITAEALRRSVRAPLDSGRVYPERFDAAYAAWKALDASRRPVCDTSVEACLK
jgi:hypothetical protein